MTQTNENGPEKGKNVLSPRSLAALTREQMKKWKRPTSRTNSSRFQGEGVFYKGKLIGVRDVPASRGEAMCANAMKQAKHAVLATRISKTRIKIQINFEGIKIIDDKSNIVYHNLSISGLSFVARDATDSRAFGIIYGNCEQRYRFYGIKTTLTADHTVLAIRDMLQIAFEQKYRQMEKKKEDKCSEYLAEAQSGVVVANLLDLETDAESVRSVEQGVEPLVDLGADFKSLKLEDNEPAGHKDSWASLFSNNPIDINTDLISSIDISQTETDGFPWPSHIEYKPIPWPEPDHIPFQSEIRSNSPMPNEIASSNSGVECTEETTVDINYPELTPINWTTPQTAPCCKALYNYQTNNPEDLEFNEGSIIELISQIDDNWFQGQLDGKKGLFPASFVQIITPLKNDQQSDHNITAPTSTIYSRLNVKSEYIVQSENKIHQCDSLSAINISSSIPRPVPCCKALYSYQSDNSEDLEFQEGSTIELISQIDANWFQGRLNDKKGLFPASFVQVIIPLNP